jgi:hypothetical protein
MVKFAKIADFGYLRNIMEKGFARKIMARSHRRPPGFPESTA